MRRTPQTVILFNLILRYDCSIKSTFSGGSISYKSVFQIAFSERNVNFTPSIKSCFLSTLGSGAQKKIPPFTPFPPFEVCMKKKLKMHRFR